MSDLFNSGDNTVDDDGISNPGSNDIDSGFGGGGNSSSTSFSFNLGTLTGSNFTYTRNDTVSTYRDSNGQLRLALANTPRFNHDINGNPLGLRAEGSRTNLCTNFNMVPTDGTNISVTGTVVLTQVSDTTAVAAYKAGNIVTGSVQHAVGGASGGTVIIAGATGATGTYAAQIVVRDVVSTGASFGITPSPTVTAIAGAAYTLYLSPALTSTAITDTMVITIPAGVTINFMLNQLEAGGNCSSVIQTSGASAIRQYDVLVDLSIATRTYFNLTNGSIIINVSYDDINNLSANTSPFFYGAGSTGLVYAIAGATQPFTTRRKSFPRLYVNSVSQYSADVSSIDEQNERYPFAMSWQNGTQATFASGAAVFWTFTIGTVVGIDRLYLGCRSTSESIFGHIINVTMAPSYISPSPLGQYMVNTGDQVQICSGQSNMVGWFDSNTDNNNTGEISAKATIDPVLSSTRNWVSDGAMNATSLLYYAGTSTAINWWYNLSTRALGVPFLNWIAVAQGCAKGTITVMIDKAGESDAFTGGATQVQYVSGVLAKNSIQRSYLGKNMLTALACISANSQNLPAYQTIRQAQKQVIAQNPTLFFSTPETFDLPLNASGLHLTDAGYATDAMRRERKILWVLGQNITGPVDGPVISAASRVSTTITCTLSYPTGTTDFTPSSAIQGFRFFDGSIATEITIIAAARVDATHIALTLASPPANGNDLLYYAYGSLSEVTDLSKLVHGNDANTLPLEALSCTLPYTAPTPNPLTQITWGDGTLVTSGDGTNLTWSM